MRTMLTTMPASLLATGWLAIAVSVAQGGDGDPRFNRDVRPVLAETCFRCHGPGVKKAGLRLDQREAALKPTESGEIPIVPGKTDESELIRRIFSEDESEVMPPPSAKKPLTLEQKNLLKQWVELGAPYEAHWSYTAPVKDQAPRPQKGASAGAGNPIDAFIADRLQRDGLSMTPEADKETLIRRVAFTLTGLPPTPREVDAFLGDSSSKAYENMVERYLFSPRYGEEMARHWLDVARYADTHGLHLDNERQMWHYRDWVVKSFNDNQPFDRFTIEQLAGDLLPEPTPDQLIATGFNRCGVTTSEGGSIDAEWYFRNAVERVSTMAETWMGMTAGCAVCHDHKFDPLSAKEFYSLYAFFYSAAGPAMDGNALLHEPTLKLPTPRQKGTLAELDARLAEVRQELDRQRQALAYRDPAETAKPVGADQAASKPSAEGVDPRANDPNQSFRAWSKLGGVTEAKSAPAGIQALLKKAHAGPLPPAEESSLRAYYLENVCEATKGPFKPLLEQVTALTKERTELDAQIVATYIFKDLDKPRDAFVMLRGQYDAPGTKVEPGTPAVLPPLHRGGTGTRATRLDLANWLVSPEHPLTGRVTVNRFWQQLFGTGLVKTAFDFGTQGEPPSHPELLDWLAVSFRESGWDVKALVRLMVNSATFRQSSRITPDLLKRDPENRLYARGPRYRLDAEQIRDNALFVSGLVNFEMGGRGVRPYQPPNIWEPVAFTGSNTRSYQPDTGAAVYRRSLYTFMKRTAPPPFLTNFDAPNREAFCTRRERSNTPLQALQLMNDVQHFEAARALAEQMMSDGGATPADRIRHGFRLVLARRPEAEELSTLEDQFGKHLARFVRDPEAAKKVVHVGNTPSRATLPELELAAYALVANTLLNLDETVTKN
ncbi:Planctomycete cytochrome C [Singulisphaera sp. GP187]|uniref:PSD1 and planctomycete cytochrome C domain-containing protein n=1 Tax=Singulisphaera sp. GP187 TaxID=1882752 RepID=UPI0009272E59|nr:PSD1 and planctomycete cytochrome C domain-containing protein [Singulisphaera sp. GP187]SIO22788.1 Planctomycete cytochrome C [Singulisphaera sp. GP187]